MRESLAGSLKTQLVKAKKFDVLEISTAKTILPELKTDSLDAIGAANLAKQLNCEAVTRGRFFVNGKQFRLEMEGIDALTGNIVSAEKSDGKLDGEMFKTIDQVVETLSADMTLKLPNMSPDQVHRNQAVEQKLGGVDGNSIQEKPQPIKPAHIGEKDKLVALKLNTNAYISVGLPIGKIAEHLGVHYGVRGTIWANALYSWLNPLIILDAINARGKNINGMFFYYAGTGLTYPISIQNGVSLMPFATFGISGGNLDYQGGYGFTLPAIDSGVFAEMPLTTDWKIATSLSYRHVFDQFVPAISIQFSVGVGYAF
ncbi:hypothetical protein Turpa_3326 [Turneriella parva DSM 21527]|uniref:Uncharacterized protein n=2 Tax=Turneriella TaxID=338321 RepID=I4B9K7_TURPD|nr:hypothetical protein Turpa_3326 [Turneriella parva DSM 21527]